MTKFEYFIKRIKAFIKLITPFIKFGIKAYKAHKEELKKLLKK